MSKERSVKKQCKFSDAQILLTQHLRELGLWHDYRWEYQFHEERKFRFDIADITAHIGYECDGGQWSGGHMRGKKLEDQYEKDRLAQLCGWRIFRFTNRQILKGLAKDWIAEHLLGQIQERE